jgi:hypothetical protein
VDKIDSALSQIKAVAIISQHCTPAIEMNAISLKNALNATVPIIILFKFYP